MSLERKEKKSMEKLELGHGSCQGMSRCIKISNYVDVVRNRTTCIICHTIRTRRELLFIILDRIHL